jgi:tRNA(Ile)-lysidine synthase
VKADPVEVAFLHAVRDLLRPDDLVVVGCSGGGDSVALLHLLHRLSPKRRPMLLVAHLDHGMRRGSAADRAFVEKLAAGLDLPSVADRREVPALRRKSESPEQAARRVRRAFLLEVARTTGATKVALGHTQDDQAETVLMRLVRGAGPGALLGMRAAGPGPLVRPLLTIEREDLRAWLRRKRIRFREDPSNRDVRFDRNFIRREVIPLLRKRNPGAVRHIAEGAARLRDDVDYLDALAREAFDEKVSDTFPGVLRSRIARLVKEP